MIYTKSNNTYFATPKDDVKDKISLEIGDSKQPDFKPQVKIMRWDNEVNFSARLVTDIVQEPVKIGDKIKTENIDFYEIEPCEEHPEGAYEFEVILKEKPKTNVVEFTLNTKGLDFFYQPELEDSEVEEMAKQHGITLLEAKRQWRPENVVGSYAIYASENKINYVGGKEYKTGKVGHIFRPRIEDANGGWIWGDLHIENGILSVTIPQEFLDKAVYPVRHAAGLTFGYTGYGGGTVYIPNSNNTYATLNTAPADYGTASKLSTYISWGYTSYHFKGLIALASTKALVANGIGSAGDCPVTASWVDSSFSSSPTLTPSTNYYLAIVDEHSTFSNEKIYYDSKSSASLGSGSNSYSSPTTLIGSPNTYNFSIYITYTAGGGASGPANLKSYNTNLKANIKSINTNLIANVKSLNTNV